MSLSPPRQGCWGGGLALGALSGACRGPGQRTDSPWGRREAPSWRSRGWGERVRGGPSRTPLNGETERRPLRREAAGASPESAESAPAPCHPLPRSNPRLEATGTFQGQGTSIPAGRPGGWRCPPQGHGGHTPVWTILRGGGGRYPPLGLLSQLPPPRGQGGGDAGTARSLDSTQTFSNKPAVSRDAKPLFPLPPSAHSHRPAWQLLPGAPLTPVWRQPHSAPPTSVQGELLPPSLPSALTTDLPSFCKDFPYLSERGERRKGEKRWARETSMGSVSRAPHWGPGLQSRQVPRLGTEPVTLWSAGLHPTPEPHRPGPDPLPWRPLLPSPRCHHLLPGPLGLRGPSGPHAGSWCRWPPRLPSRELLWPVGVLLRGPCAEFGPRLPTRHPPPSTLQVPTPNRRHPGAVAARGHWQLQDLGHSSSLSQLHPRLQSCLHPPACPAVRWAGWPSPPHPHHLGQTRQLS